MSWRIARILGFAACAAACSSGGSQALGTRASSEESREVDAFCDDAGPPCGFSLTFEPGLPVGSYAITVTTASGATSCELEIEPERLQTEAEAEAQDAMLAACAEEGTCPPKPCTGPDTVYLGSHGLTVLEESSEISVRVSDVESGGSTQATFAPAYADHPRRTATCHTCRVAADTLRLEQ